MKKPDNKTGKRKFGDIGEDIASRFLEKRGFEIIDRNYLRKWGEIDIVAKKSEVIHFIEVKSVSRETITENGPQQTKDGYRPEDNLHPWKLKRLSRVIQTYLLQKDINSDWQFDVVTVKISQKDRLARVEIIENIIL